MEQINLTNTEISPKNMAISRELAKKLNAIAPDNVSVRKLTKSLDLGYTKAARNFYYSQIDKFRQISPETKRIIEEGLLSLE